MKLQVPIRENLFEEKDNQATLLGSKCGSCGKVFFPPKAFCPNCLGKELEQLPVGGRGTLYSFSIVNMPTEHYKAPYAVAWIELPNAIRVFSQIKGWEGHQLKIGEHMELVIDKLWEEEERDVIGYFFRPEQE
jgi:uncharacterized protein